MSRKRDVLDPVGGNPHASSTLATNTPAERAAATRSVIRLFETGRETATNTRQFLEMLGLIDTTAPKSERETCPAGIHPWTTENRLVRSLPGRTDECRKCRNERERERRAARKNEAG